MIPEGRAPLRRESRMLQKVFAVDDRDGGRREREQLAQVEPKISRLFEEINVHPAGFEVGAAPDVQLQRRGEASRPTDGPAMHLLDPQLQEQLPAGEANASRESRLE